MQTSKTKATMLFLPGLLRKVTQLQSSYCSFITAVYEPL